MHISALRFWMQNKSAVGIHLKEDYISPLFYFYSDYLIYDIGGGEMIWLR